MSTTEHAETAEGFLQTKKQGQFFDYFLLSAPSRIFAGLLPWGESTSIFGSSRDEEEGAHRGSRDRRGSFLKAPGAFRHTGKRGKWNDPFFSH